MQIYLTRADVAARMQISEKLAGRIMREEMTCVMIGKRRRVTEAEVERWQREHELAPCTASAARAKPRRRTQRGGVPSGMYQTPEGGLRFIRV